MHITYNKYSFMMGGSEVSHWNITIQKSEMKVFFYSQIKEIEYTMTSINAQQVNYTGESAET